MNETLNEWLSEPRTALTKAVTDCVRDHFAGLRKQGISPYGYALLPGEPYDQCMVDANAEFAEMHEDGVVDDFAIAHPRALLKAILNGFDAAKREGAFGVPEIYLAMWISDTGHEIMAQSVRRLNSAVVAREYRAEFG